MPTDPRPRRSLQRAVVLAFVPLLLVVVGAATAQFLLARAIGDDMQRLFEELREVAVARTLVDELHGVEQWVDAAPAVERADNAPAFHDVEHHLAAARATLFRLPVANTPSRAEHEAVEVDLHRRLTAALDALSARTAAPGPLGALQPLLREALADAVTLQQTIDAEAREIGGELDESSQDMAQYLLLLGAFSVAVVGGLGWWLRRRVLWPVRELHRAAVAFGRGELTAAPSVRQPDELGELATAFRTMAERLQQNRQELEQRVEQRSREVLRSAQLAQLGTIAAGIAHEINNPLGSIVACADGLLRDMAAPGQRDLEAVRDYLMILRKEALRARDITERLLRLARQEPARRETVWLGAEVEEVKALFEHQLHDAGVTLRVLGDGRGPPIHGNAAEWRQVLLNLLRNALDASPRGGTIRLELGTSDGEVSMAVCDEGSGIPPADLDRVFEPFFTTKQPGAGTGLGLAIVHRIVTAHGGTITAANDTPGSRFTIRLPCAPSVPAVT